MAAGAIANPVNDWVDTTPAANDWQDVSPEKKTDPYQKKSALGKFGSGLYDTTIGPIVDTAKAFATTEPGATTKSVAKMLGNAVLAQTGQFKRAKQDFQGGQYVSAVQHAAAGMTPVVGPLAQNIVDTATGNITPGQPADPEKADPARASGMATGVAATALAPKVIGKGVSTARTMIAGPTDAERLGTLVRAIKPRASTTGFDVTLQRAMPEMKATEAALGRPIAGVDDALEATKLAKQRVWGQYQDAAGPMKQIGATVDLSPLADAVEQSIPSKLRLENPEAAKAMADAAKVYRRRFSIDQAEDLLREFNAELDSYYGKYPSAQRVATTANPDTASLVAKANATRDAIYKTLDAEGEGAAPRELKQRYGSLMAVERELERRRNVAMRQQPESLSQQLGKWSGYGDIAMGAAKAIGGVLSGRGEAALSAAGDLASGITKRQMAQYLKEQQTTDALIKRAFANYTGTPEPVQMPTAPQPKGLLGPAPLVTPPPTDPSGVTVTTGPPLDTRIPPSRQLPAGPIRMPPPADPSGITVTTGWSPVPFRRAQKAAPPMPPPGTQQ